MEFIKKVFGFFASYGLACALLFFLLLLVLFGTLEQVNTGLFEVQKKYFESFWLIHYIQIGSLQLPLPLFGAYPLMALLFVNLVLGAIIRSPKHWKHPGMLIAHGGIIFLVLSSYVTFKASISGHMTLFEGESSSYFDDYYKWEVAITELGRPAESRTFRIVQHQLEGMEQGETRTFKHADLPFTLALSDWVPNAEPRQAAPMLNEKGIDGVVLAPAPTEKEAERNLAGVTAEITPTDGSPKQTSYLWGFSAGPWVVNVGDKQYGLSLRHLQYPVPFTVKLDKFIRDLHPRTMMASNFRAKSPRLKTAARAR